MTAGQDAGGELAGLTDDDVRSGLTVWAARLAAGEAEFLDLVGELDAREAWAGVGILSAAHWLSWRCSLGSNAARERVRVARALRQLPAVRAAFHQAALSYSQVRALTRVATPESEHSLIDCARHCTAVQLESIVRGMRQAVRAEELETARDAYDMRALTYYYDDDGSLIVRGRLPAGQGAAFVKGIEAAMDDLREARMDPVAPEPLDVSAETPNGPAQRADALTHLAEQFLASKRDSAADPDTYRVVVRIDAATLVDDADGEVSAIDDGPAVPPETVRRLLCDSAVRAVTELSDGTLLDLGQSSRFPNRALRRALRQRDHGCQFAGCTRLKRLHAHHIIHWSRGGPTDLQNLILLCSHHHHLVHEGGFTIERTSTGRVIVRAPAGWVIESVPRLIPTSSDDLAAAQEADGLVVDEDTLPPDWGGDRLDLGHVVWTLLQQGRVQDIA